MQVRQPGLTSALQGLNNDPIYMAFREPSTMNGAEEVMATDNSFLHQKPEVEVNVSGILFKADRSDLTIQSHYFKSVLQRDAQTVVYIEGMAPSTFAAILKWCKTSEVQLHDDNFAQVFTAADLLGIPALIAKCKAHLHQIFLTGNPSTIYEPLRNSCAKSLKQTIRDTFAENFLQIMMKPYFLKLTAKQMRSVLSHDGLLVNSEKDVFEAALNWLLFQWFKRRKFTVEVLSCIRFAFISDEDLLDCYEKPEYAVVLDLPECQQLIIKGLLYRAATRIQRTVSFSLPTKPRSSQNFPTCNSDHRQKRKSNRAVAGSSIIGTSVLSIGKRRLVRSVPEFHSANDPTLQQNTNNGDRVRKFSSRRHVISNTSPDPTLEWSDHEDSNSDDSMANAMADKKNANSIHCMRRSTLNVKSKEARQDQQSPRGLFRMQNRRHSDIQSASPVHEMPTRSSVSADPLIVRRQLATTPDKRLGYGIKAKSFSSSSAIDCAVQKYFAQLSLSLKRKGGNTKLTSDDAFSIVGNTSSMSNSSRQNQDSYRNTSKKKPGMKHPGSLELVCPSCLVVFKKFNSDHYLVNKSTSPLHPQKPQSKWQLRNYNSTEVSRRDSDEGSIVSSKHTFPVSPKMANQDVCYDGSSILIFCGINPKENDTGGNHMFLLNPRLTDTWALYDHNPFSRIHAAAVLLDDNIYVLGGCDPRRSHKNWPWVTSECLPLKTNVCYNVTQRVWSSKANMRMARCHHAAVVFKNMIYVLAGMDERHQMLSSVERYDPTKNEWERIGHMKSARMGLCAVVFRGTIWSCGGVAYDADNHDYLCTTTVEIYVYGQDIWMVHPCSLRRPRSFSVMIAWSDSMLLMAGGATGVFNDQQQAVKSCRSIEVFSEVGRRWERRGGMQMKRHSAAAAIYGHYLYVIGGCSTSPKDKLRTATLNQVERIDLLSFESHSTSNLPMPLVGSAALILPEFSSSHCLRKVSPCQSAGSSSS